MKLPSLITAGPRCSVVFRLQVLTTTDENEGFLHGGVAGRNSGIMQCFQEELRVRHIGA